MLSWCLVTERWSEPALKPYFFQTGRSRRVPVLFQRPSTCASSSPFVLRFASFVACQLALARQLFACLSCFSRASLPSSFKPKFMLESQPMMLQCAFSFLCLKHTAILLGLCSAGPTVRIGERSSPMPDLIGRQSDARLEGCELLRRDQMGVEQISIRKQSYSRGLSVGLPQKKRAWRFETETSNQKNEKTDVANRAPLLTPVLFSKSSGLAYRTFQLGKPFRLGMIRKTKQRMQSANGSNRASVDTTRLFHQTNERLFETITDLNRSKQKKWSQDWA